jgi:hypothetical protein
MPCVIQALRLRQHWGVCIYFLEHLVFFLCWIPFKCLLFVSQATYEETGDETPWVQVMSTRDCSLEIRNSHLDRR